jgi:hypothetical protein
MPEGAPQKLNSLPVTKRFMSECRNAGIEGVLVSRFL